jgi:GPN-loop GTPase
MLLPQFGSGSLQGEHDCTCPIRTRLILGVHAQIPYKPNIDVRDSVKYKDIMRQYSLGPNGAILTSLNLFAAQFNQVRCSPVRRRFCPALTMDRLQVMDILERRAPEHDVIAIDTPGQIEVFTWSASGTIITESLASTLPTVIVYVLDTPRCMSPVTFVSNMLYACRCVMV